MTATAKCSACAWPRAKPGSARNEFFADLVVRGPSSVLLINSDATPVCAKRSARTCPARAGNDAALTTPRTRRNLPQPRRDRASRRRRPGRTNRLTGRRTTLPRPRRPRPLTRDHPRRPAHRARTRTHTRTHHLNPPREGTHRCTTVRDLTAGAPRATRTSASESPRSPHSRKIRCVSLIVLRSCRRDSQMGTSLAKGGRKSQTWTKIAGTHGPLWGARAALPAPPLSSPHARVTSHSRTSESASSQTCRSPRPSRGRAGRSLVRVIRWRARH